MPDIYIDTDKYDEEDKQYVLQKRNKIIMKAYNKKLEQILLENFTLKCQLGTADAFLQDIYNENAILRKQLIEKTECEARPYIWLTIRPSNITFKEFEKVINKMMSKKWIKTYLYVYEQTGVTEQEIGKGFHFHGLIYKGTKRNQQCIDEFRNTLKHIIDLDSKYVNNFFNLNFIPIKYVKTKINYMLGHKQSSHENVKDIKQKYDRPFRDQYGIQQYYKSEDFEIPNDIQFYTDSKDIAYEDISDNESIPND